MSRTARRDKDNKENCEHFAGIAETEVSPKTPECEECEKEGTDWVALRMCLLCGHVGCCDSSEGLHATRHFKQTGHPVMIALHNSHGNGVMYIGSIISYNKNNKSHKH